MYPFNERAREASGVALVTSLQALKHTCTFSTNSVPLSKILRCLQNEGLHKKVLDITCKAKQETSKGTTHASQIKQGPRRDLIILVTKLENFDRNCHAHDVKKWYSGGLKLENSLLERLVWLKHEKMKQVAKTIPQGKSPVYRWEGFG